jgi:hypothetical protein
MLDKDTYVQKLRAKIDEWDTEIDKLKAKVDKAEGASRFEFQKEIENLQQRRQEVGERLTKVRHSVEGAWEDISAGARNAWDAMEEALRSAKSKII